MIDPTAASTIAVATLALAAVYVVNPANNVQLRRKRSKVEKNEMNGHTHPSKRKKVGGAIVFDGIQISTECVVSEMKRQANSGNKQRIIYTFLNDHGKEMMNLSFEDIDIAARSIAATLQLDAGIQKGDRVILCYPPGLDFALSFWGCLYAGAIAIPVYPPYPGTLAKDLPKFNRLVADSGAQVVLTNRTYHLASKMATAKEYFTYFRGNKEEVKWPEHLKWITTDSISNSMALEYDDTDALSIEMSDVAFFQYSSGSTSAPKAVQITHGNLRAQLKTWESIQRTDTLVSWLPSYHDMGLIGFIVVPALTGSRCVSMSPISFIKDPSIWMRIVSEYQATHVCAPNFGYALAARKTAESQVEKLRLGCLKQAICAAEPIRPEALLSFINKFHSAGFNPKVFNCGYGLAEVTLVSTGLNPLQPEYPIVLHVEKTALEQQKKAIIAKEVRLSSENVDVTPLSGCLRLVGCGKAMPTFRLKIVDPNTMYELGECHVGEVWIEGPSVANGYYGRPDMTKDQFHAKINKPKSNNNYLRSGDLGFLYKGYLFITGRLKDLIIVRGRNICPQDVEVSVENAHEAVRPGCCAAFSVENEQQKEETLVVVAEVRTDSKSDSLVDICQAIQMMVLSEHQLNCEAIVLLKQHTIPKTTSGKIQRSAAKAKFVAESYGKHALAIHRSKQIQQKITKTIEPVQTSTKEQSSGEKTIKTPDEILKWLLARMSIELENEESGSTKEAQQMDPNIPWASYGLDSVAIVGLSAELGEYLDCVVPPSAFFQFDSPYKLAHAPGLPTGDLEDLSTDTTDQMASSAATIKFQSIDEIDSSTYEFEEFPEVKSLIEQKQAIQNIGLKVPYLEVITPEIRSMINFNTYNYLGHASLQDVSKASIDAINFYGTTMSSSPIVGQTQVAADLEHELCKFFDSEASILFVGGWVANVTTIDSMVGLGDLILCDALNHDSCVTGQRLSGAKLLPFPHNDTKALERMLQKLRCQYRRVLIVIEGIYSMDGDMPDLREMIRIKKKYKALLFLDEAHSFGTMGTHGKGLVEHFQVNPKDIDVRMGTMSKALGSVGGFMLASETFIQYLKHCAGGYVFSVGLAPSCCAAALQSLRLMSKTNGRTQLLQSNATYFYDLCKENQIPMGKTTHRGAPVVVVMSGSTLDTVKLSAWMATEGKINVKPIVYPAVEEGKCRLRFFISALHTKAQLNHTIQMLKQALVDKPKVESVKPSMEPSTKEKKAKKKKSKKAKTKN